MALTEVEERVTSAFTAVAPSVAVVSTVRPVRRSGNPFSLPAAGTAVIIDRTGYLVTNQHVVDEASEVRVRLGDGRELEGRVVGEDPVTDVALIQVRDSDLPAAHLGDSDELRVGQTVLALGNALGLPGSPTLSSGIVSALGRPLPGSDFVFEGLIQTDAAINPGNSGGPLVNLERQVVGINTAVMAFAQGVGFAIPIRTVERVIRDLREKGRVARPWIGASIAEVGPELAAARGLPVGSGLLVAEVVAQSPAHRAGLEAGDLLTRVGPFPVRRTRDLLEALARFPVGSDVEVGFRRGRSDLSAAVPLQERSAAAVARRRPRPFGR